MISITCDASGRQRWFYGICCIFIFAFLWLPVNVSAESLTITAIVHSPPPTQPALITSHHDGQHVTQEETVIKGTCSNDTAFVELWRNDIFSGMAICTSGEFEIPFTFLPGPNILYTKTLSSTGNPGPTSPQMTVYYDVPTPESPEIITLLPTLPPPLGSPCNAEISPLSITLHPSFQEGVTGTALTWSIETFKGCAPYELSVEWGDGVTTAEEAYQDPYVVTHTYYQPGQYLVHFHMTDASGQKIDIQAIVVIKGNAIETPPQIPDTSSWVIPTLTVAVAASSAAVTLLVFGRKYIIRGIRLLLRK